MKKFSGILVCMLLMISLLSGCGAAASDAYYEGASAEAKPMENGWSSDAAEAPMKSEESGESASVPQQKRKLIRNAELSLESKQFNETRTQILQAAQELDGYVEHSSEHGSEESGDRYAEYVLRIPCDRYDDFLTSAENAGSLVRKDEDVRDVTREYVDVEARLESLRTQEKRLLELAAQAETMEDLLTIEAHLSNVRYEIESYTVQQRTLDDQVDYSSIRVMLYEVAVYSPVNRSFGSEVAEAFSGSWKRFVSGLRDFIIWLIYALPTLIILAAAGIIVLMVMRKTAPNRQKRKAAKRQKHNTSGGKTPPAYMPPEQTPIYQKGPEPESKSEN